MTVTMPDAELAPTLAEAVAAAVREALAAPPLPRLAYTPRQAAEISGLSARWLSDQASAEQIPSIKVGQSRLFSMDNLVAILAAHAQNPSSGPMARK